MRGRFLFEEAQEGPVTTGEGSTAGKNVGYPADGDARQPT
jgi:hypothetical protein